MVSCKIGGVKFKFKNNFTDLTLNEISLYLQGLEEYDSHYQVFLKLTDEDSLADERNYEDLEQVIDDILLAKLKILTVLDTRKKFGTWFLQAQGVSPDDIHYLFDQVTETIKDFTGFWDSLPAVDEFKFGLWTRYKVHEMSGYTVQRSSAIAGIVNKVFNFKKELDAGSYRNMIKLVAYIVRPVKLPIDAGINKRAFYKKKRGLTEEEQYEYYLLDLQSHLSKQVKLFQDLPAATAIGVIKAYFAKKKE